MVSLLIYFRIIIDLILIYLFDTSCELEEGRLFSASLNDSKSVLVVALDLASSFDFNVVLVILSVLSSRHWASKHNNSLWTGFVASLDNLWLLFSKVLPNDVVVSSFVPFPLVVLINWFEFSIFLHLSDGVENLFLSWYWLSHWFSLFIYWKALFVHANLIRVTIFIFLSFQSCLNFWR